MTTFNTNAFNTAVNDFKKDFAGDPNLFTAGQFYLTVRTTSDLLASIESELNSSMTLNFAPGGAKNNIAQIMASLKAIFNTTPVNSINLDRVTNILAGNISGEILSLLAAGPPGQIESSQVQANFQQIWTNPNLPGAAPPWLSGTPTFRKALAARALELKKCFDVARGMANKRLKANKVKSLSRNLRISTGVIGRADVRQFPASGAGFEAPQTIIYRDPVELRKVVAGMRTAIDASAVVQCGVLSGVRQDTNLFIQPEHYVLAFAYGAVDGMDAFLFWDPDAVRSNIAAAGWGPGFGCLISAAGRLSTAVDDSDLMAIDTDPSSNTSGDHLNQTRRHRYQVYYVQTLPA